LNPEIYNIVLRKGSSTTYRATLEETSHHPRYSMQPVIIIFGIIVEELKRRTISPSFCHLIDMIPTRDREDQFLFCHQDIREAVRG
jgi:hypothetical protein